MSEMPPGSYPPQQPPSPPPTIPPQPPSPFGQVPLTTPVSSTPLVAEYGFGQRPRGPEWGGIVAWIVILACVAFVAYRVTRAYARIEALGEDPGGDIQIMLLGRTAVALNALTKTAAATTAPTTAASTTATTSTSSSSASVSMSAADATSDYVKSLDQAAKTSEEKLEAATVAAEIQGADAGLKRLEELERDLAKHRAASATSSPAAPASMPATTQSAAASIDDDIAALRTIYTRGLDALSAEQKQQLIVRHDYFGRLATTFGLPHDNPQRSAVIRESMMKLVVVGVVGVVFILILLLALASFITAIVLAAMGKFRRAYIPEPFVNSAYVEAFAWYLGLFLLFSVALHKFNENAGIIWEWSFFLIIAIAMLWVHWRGNPPSEVARGFGWYVPTNFWREVGCGIAGWFAGVPIVALGLLITSKLNKWAGAAPTHPIVHMLREGGLLEVLALYSVAAVFAPIVEETMFRGALFHHMRRRWGWWVSASLVALIFAGIHPQGWTMIPTLGAIAMVLAALREWRGSLVASMAAHATNNFIVLSLGLAIAR